MYYRYEILCMYCFFTYYLLFLHTVSGMPVKCCPALSTVGTCYLVGPNVGATLSAVGPMLVQYVGAMKS